MKVVVCPHCKNHRIVTAKIPKDVVVVLPCPVCQELVVLFRGKIIAVSRKILENGSREERKEHLATIIDQFLDPAMFEALASQEVSEEEGESEGEAFLQEPNFFAEGEEEEASAPISQREVDHFVKIELNRLDDASYFKKHFPEDF